MLLDSENCLFTFKQPFLTPALLILHRFADIDLLAYGSPPWQSQDKALMVTLPIAVGSAVSLLPSPISVLNITLGGGFFLSQLSFYARVIKIWRNQGDLSTPQMALGVVNPVTYRVVPLLLVVVLGSAFVSPRHVPFARDIVFFGMLKLARWVFVFIAVSLVSTLVIRVPHANTFYRHSKLLGILPRQCRPLVFAHPNLLLD
jgi:hypothetical protein